MLEGWCPSIISGEHGIAVAFGIRKQIKILADNPGRKDVRFGKKKIVSKKMTLIITITQTENVQGWLGVGWRVCRSLFGPGLWQGEIITGRRIPRGRVSDGCTLTNPAHVVDDTMRETAIPSLSILHTYIHTWDTKRQPAINPKTTTR